MTGNDPFTNALAGMDNAESVGHLSYTVEPASNIIGSVLEVLYDRGYVDGFEYVDDGKAGKFEVELKGAINECGAVKPRYSAGPTSSRSGRSDTSPPVTTGRSSSRRATAL